MLSFVFSFRDGIHAYLAAHAYGNTETYDLWDALEASSGEPVRRMMDAWIWQGRARTLSAASNWERLYMYKTVGQAANAFLAVATKP